MTAQQLGLMQWLGAGLQKVIPKKKRLQKSYTRSHAQRSWPNIVHGGLKPHRRDTRDTLCRDNHVPVVIIQCEDDGRSPSRIPEKVTYRAP
ncbi:hypothetical protein AVEN_167254-1 [Araneus ventricosus]|uniref:Uncharacterized protein n=1 Tax=Araneus ventricosus TaxID=182803 RepID=A0A4Y2HG10_ARAVE|nr:hypothetical protein AVEN_167254-1 [Araneus ventricosus]